MIPRAGQGLFISFEGIEGTGKSTQVRLLADVLQREGREVVVTAEPGGTGIGQQIRALLMHVDHTHLDPVAELLLYGADRRQHIAEVIAPALEAGSVVITDRYSDSTRAYQGVARGLGTELIETLDGMATGGLKPDLTVLLDMDVEEGLRRNSDEGKVDRFELENAAFHRAVREAFLAIQKAEPGRVVLVDAARAVEAVHAEVLEHVRRFMKKA
jgi:dTMP kinase